MKIFLLFCVCVMLAACQNKIDERLQYDPAVFKQGKKGIVIVSISQERKQRLGSTPESLNFHLTHLETNQDFINATTSHDVFSSALHHQYQNCILMLDPGVYGIKKLFLADKREGNYIVRGWYTDNLSKVGDNTFFVKIGAFEVKPGQVLYLGKLELEESGRLPFKIINEIDIAKTDLKEAGKTDLASKIEFGNLYQRGTIIKKSGNAYIFNDGIEGLNKQSALLDALT